MTEPTKASINPLSPTSIGDRAVALQPTSHSPLLFNGRKKVLALLLAILVTLGASELGLRLLWHNPFRHESPDHLLKLRIHHPHTDHIFRRSPAATSPDQWVRLRTDARSYILPSMQYKDPDATIAFLGGSTTECSAVEEGVRFPALISQLLAKEGLKVNTLNAARSGNTLHDSINVLLNHVIEDRPDIAVVMEASNDIGLLKEAGGYQSRMGSPVSSTDFAKWWLQIASSKLYLAALARAGATAAEVRATDPANDWRRRQPVFNAPSVKLFRQRLKAFVQICRSFAIEPVVMTQPFSGSRNALTPSWIDATAQDQFNAVIRMVGEEEGVAVIDLVSYLQEEASEWNKPMVIFYDAIHVTDKGSQVYAQYISERLLPLIRQRLSGGSLER